MLSKNEIEKELFEALAGIDERRFIELLKKNNPNIKWEGTPLLHLVVRNAGPEHLWALIELGADVNILTDQGGASALQWITGMLYPQNYLFGWPYNYDESQGKRCAVGLVIKELDIFVGSANEVMLKISNKLLKSGAKLDFYSACALNSHEWVKKYLMKHPEQIAIPGPDGGSALAWAARRGQNAIISLLLEYGADINQLGTESSLTPLEEAVLFHGTKATIELLVQKEASIKQGIIGLTLESKRDSARMAITEFLLEHADDPNNLVTLNDIKKIKSTVYYKKYLRVFAKQGISLSKIDNELQFDHCPLIFDGCSGGQELLKLLIHIGCDINATFPQSCVNFGNGNESITKYATKLIDATPMVHLYLELQPEQFRKEKSVKEQLNILQKMAILFIQGSSIDPLHEVQPHPLKDLHGIHLINFLLFLHEEIIINNQEYLPYNANINSCNLLKDKINESCVTIESDELNDSVFNTHQPLDCVKNNLKQLLGFCEFIKLDQVSAEDGSTSIDDENITASETMTGAENQQSLTNFPPHFFKPIKNTNSPNPMDVNVISDITTVSASSKNS